MRIMESSLNLGRARRATIHGVPMDHPSTEELLVFERMLADLSARFANVPVDRVELEIQTAQATLRQFLEFDRSSYLEFQEDGLPVVISSSAIESVESVPLGPFTPR